MNAKKTIDLPIADCDQKVNKNIHTNNKKTQLNIICIVICILKLRKTENDAKKIYKKKFV